MSIWVLEMIFIVILIFNIEDASFVWSCLIMAGINVLFNLFTGFAGVGFLGACIQGLLLGALGFGAALLCQAIIEEMGILGKIVLTIVIALILYSLIF